MVCHETYKDENNKWISPDEVFTENGKDYFKTKDKKILVEFIRVNVKVKEEYNRP